MLAVFALAAALWGLGAVFKVPRSTRWAGIGLLYLAVLLALALLPVAHPLRLALGVSLQGWLVLGGGVAAAFAYGLGLRRLRAKARPAAVERGGFSATELDRYSRHILLREIGGPGQGRLRAAKVLVIGAGGLGSSALLYLAASGVGTIGVIDGDVVENSNLQRQVIHSDARIGQPKVFSAQAMLSALNPFITLHPYYRRLDAENAPALFAEYDLILDGSDDFATRALVNRVAVGLGKPVISGALAQWEGQVSLFDPVQGGPCLACIFPAAPAPGLVPDCAQAGVAAPLPGVIGTMMALEAVKLLTGAGTGLRGRLLIHDGLHGETRMIALARRADCRVCGA